MSDKLENSLGCVAALLFLGFGAFQVYAASIGLSDSLGIGWAIGLIAISFMARTSIPVIIGAFLCAKNVWEWHWALAALFAAPGLALILPSMAANILEAFSRKR
jgi:hypothetical protein